MASKVYSVKYTDNADLPRARAPIVINSGKLRSIQVPFLTEGYITRLTVKQTDGTDVDCYVEVLDSKIPYPPGEQDSGTEPDDDIELYRIMSPQTVQAGSALVITSEEYGYPFHNQDGSYSDNQRCIYLVLDPQSAEDDTTWEISLTGHNEIG